MYRQKKSFLRQYVITEFEALFARYSQLRIIQDDIITAYFVLGECFNQHGKVLVCGNGGSAADSQHIVGELMKSFKTSRALDNDFIVSSNKVLSQKQAGNLQKNLEGALPAISLVGENALSTAFANDRTASYVFAQQVYGLGVKGDVLLAISTSGNSENVVLAAQTALVKDMKVVALTGANNSDLSELSTVSIQVPETETHKIQELHLPVYHALCAALEKEFFTC